MITVVIVSFNSENEIDACLSSLLRSKGVSLEVIVVDNASTDSTCKIVSKYLGVKLLQSKENLGFPGGNNVGLRNGTGDYCLLLNPDTIVPENSIKRLLAYAQGNPGYGVIGPQLVGSCGEAAPDLRPIGPGLIFSRYTNRVLKQNSVEVVSGAAMFFSRKVYDMVGGLDENLFWCEDHDFCYRVRRAGFSIAIVRDVSVVHLGQRSGNRNKAVMIEKSYTSKIGFLAKYRSAFYVKCVVLVFLFELLLRIVKWGVKWAQQGSRAESKERVRIYLHVCSKLLGIILQYPYRTTMV